MRAASYHFAWVQSTLILQQANRCRLIVPSDAREVPTRRIGLPVGYQLDSALLCEFDRIGYEVNQDVSQSRLVHIQPLRDAVIYQLQKLEVLLLGLNVMHVKNFVKELSDADGLHVQLKLLGLDFRKVKDVVNHGYQVL